MAHIRQGKHYDSNPFSSLPFICLDEMSRYVTFTDSCRYTLSEYNQQDINKLFGMAFGFDHHVNSARFGWAYNPATDRIDIYSYCYIRGERKSHKITEVQIGRTYKFCLEAFKTKYVFTVQEMHNVSDISYSEPHVPTPCYGYTLGLYFGGALPAPHDMEIKVRS